MTKLVLHNSIFYLSLMAREYGISENLLDPLFITSCVLKEFSEATQRSSITLLIPAFDYSAFKTSTVLVETNTEFLYASALLKSDVIHRVCFDPVFRYISISPSEANSNETPLKDEYQPFAYDSDFLCEDDYVGFTPDSFQPSFLMYIENKFFASVNKAHPYRRIKTFFWKYADGRDIIYRYGVRPKDIELRYDLGRIKKDLETSDILYRTHNGCLYGCYGAVESFVMERLQKDNLYLLEEQSKKYLEQYENQIIPEHNF